MSPEKRIDTKFHSWFVNLTSLDILEQKQKQKNKNLAEIEAEYRQVKSI